MKLVIIGGVAGGATAAARGRRLDEKAEIILFERGEYISFANCGLPYYIGNVIKERSSLLVTTEEDFSLRYNIDIRSSTEALSIDKSNRSIAVKNLKTGETYSETYDKLILSPGAEPLKPPIEGVDLENIFCLRNIPDTDRIKTFVDSHTPKAAVVVGGGFIGLEMAENLADRGIDVTIIEMLDQVMAPLDNEMANMVHEELADQGITCALRNQVTAFKKKGDRLKVVTKCGDEFECDLVILAIGVRPENQLARDAGLRLGERGGIIVDSSMRTSDPHIYAVGDAVETREYVTGLPVMIPLAGPANKQGRIAADNVMGRKSVYRGSMGTSVLKLFDMTVASTGPNERFLKKHGVPYMTSYTHSKSHASYYPGAEFMSIKLIFSPGNGKLLGAQIIGRDGVDKRIDVLATAIRGDMTVFDLEELELAYAPPYSSAKDPVNMAGFVGSNILKGDLDPYRWLDAGMIDPDTEVLIDVREPDEIVVAGEMDGALNIPLDTLRDKLPELDKDKIYLLTCSIGLRGYIGYRIMAQNGFKVRNISGGINTLKYAQSQSDPLAAGT